MYVPTVNIRTTAVELSSERRALIIRKLTQIGRLLSADEHGSIDVVLRQYKNRFGGSKYYLSVKLSTAGSVYNAMAIEPRLERALRKTLDTLKKAISKGSVRQEFSFRTEGLHTIDHYRLLLGNH